MSSSITWLGHSAFRLTLADGRVILIDPWLSENPAFPEKLKNPPRCDFIIMTHGHSDHVGDVPALVRKFNPVVVGNYDLCTVMQRLIGSGRFEMMNTGGTITVDDVQFTLAKAFHSSAVDTPQGPAYGGMPNGVVIAVEGLAVVYHAGDTDVFGDMKLIAQLFAPKVCILPIGDRFTMGTKGASLAAEMLQPSAIIPCHYKTFPILGQSADAFRDALPANLRKRLFVPDVGESLSWTATGIGSAA